MIPLGAFLIIFPTFALGAMAEVAQRWPAAAPDCWSEARMVHTGDFADLWRANTSFKKTPVGTLKPGVYSPNKGYYFVAEDGRPHGAVTIFAEKPYLVRIEFSQLFGLAEVKWINEKLLYMRPWWGRIAATDLIYDVEAEKVIYSEGVMDGYLAFQQFRAAVRWRAVNASRKSRSDSSPGAPFDARHSPGLQRRLKPQSSGRRR